MFCYITLRHLLRHLHTEETKRAEKAKKVAEKYNLTFVELQSIFDKATEIKEDTYWLKDGVHPTEMGHELLKREWMKAFVKMKAL